MVSKLLYGIEGLLSDARKNQVKFGIWIEPGERAKKLKALEQRVYAENQTQLFIETPYRNHKMVEDILLNCRPQTKLCIAANITCEGEYIQTRTVKDWKGHVPDLSKIPCIFLLYK